MTETILIVDDEESVRRTFVGWLTESDLPIRVQSAADAETALQFANAGEVDLAILDWNLGSGSDGLQLLEDLVVFHPNVVAILITGFAHQATPLQALRMGVRDYLDKNQDLTRETFLNAVKKQLELIRPARQQRQFQNSLLEFRESVEQALPIVQSTAALQGPGSIFDAFQPFVILGCALTQAKTGYIVYRELDHQNRETITAIDGDGKPLPWQPGHFAKSLASAALVSGSPLVISLKEPDALDMIRLQEFEKNANALLAIPLLNEPNRQAVLKLVDGPFAQADQKVLKLLGQVGGELLLRGLGDRRQSQLLLAALQTARKASDSLTLSTESNISCESTQRQVMESLAETLGQDTADPEAKETLQIAERIRNLHQKFGHPALKHADRLLELTEQLLNEYSPTMND